MAGYALPENVIAGNTEHITHTNNVHDIVNKIDKDAVPIAGDGLVQNSSSLYVSQAVTIVVRWNSTTDAWPSRPSWAPFGVLFLSTNDATAIAPVDANLQVGDVWRRHPNAT